MQPYQKAGEEVQRHATMPFKALGTAATVASTVAGGSAILSRIAPLLNSFVPAGIAIKGLSRIDPRLGNFVNGAMKRGIPANEAMEFIKEKVDSGLSQSANKQQNIIQQLAPSLHEFLVDKIGQGIKPKKAAEEAAKSGKFSEEIKKVQNHTKKGIGDIIESIFGKEEPQRSHQLTGKQYSLADIVGQPVQQGAQIQQQQPQMNPQTNQPQQMGPGATALMDVLQKINQRLAQ